MKKRSHIRIKVVYSPYSDDGFVEVKSGYASGRDLSCALKKAVHFLNLNIDPDEEIESYNDSQMLELVERTSGKGCDLVLSILDYYTGELLYSAKE